MIIKDVRIVSFGTPYRDGKLFDEGTLLAVPDEIPVTWQFNHDKIIGTAKNFRKTDFGLIADIDLMSLSSYLVVCYVRMVTIKSLPLKYMI